MIADDFPQAFDQLASLGRSHDIAIRPVLMRVMVDMFANKPHHTDAEIGQFAEILSHLLDDADGETHLVVSAKLAKHPQTPRVLLDRFAAERGKVARKVLSQAAVDAGTLNAAVLLGTTAMGLAAAERPDLDPSTVRSLAERPEIEILHALAANLDAPIDAALLRYLARRARGDAGLAAKLLARPGAQVETAALFLSATRAQRAHLIADARRRDLGSTGRSLAIAVSVEGLAAIERASRVPGLDGLDGALGSLLGLDRADIDLIMDDRLGEPLALALTAVGISSTTAARIFILGDPAIGHSYARVKALVTVVETVSPRAAFRLVMGMLGRSTEMLRRTAATPQAEAPIRRSFGTAVRTEQSAAEGFGLKRQRKQR